MFSINCDTNPDSTQDQAANSSYAGLVKGRPRLEILVIRPLSLGVVAFHSMLKLVTPNGSCVLELLPHFIRNKLRKMLFIIFLSHGL